MNPFHKVYRDDGLANERAFLCDYDFAPEVQEFLMARPDCDRWYIQRCDQISLGVYEVTFITNEYLNPGNPKATLHVKAVAPEAVGDTWAISLF